MTVELHVGYNDVRYMWYIYIDTNFKILSYFFMVDQIKFTRVILWKKNIAKLIQVQEFLIHAIYNIFINLDRTEEFWKSRSPFRGSSLL